MKKPTHFNEDGEARMVDVGGKPISRRTARATGTIHMSAESFALLAGGAPKGDVLSVARLAAIGAAKRTGEWIPLCHTLPLDYVRVEFELDAADFCVHCRVESAATAKTGVEMEALVGVQAALTTVYDMLKAVDRGMSINNIRLLTKTGGQSGDFDGASSAAAAGGNGNDARADAYAAAGVDVAAADEAVRQIAQLAKKTHSALPAQNASLLGGIGGFAALIQLPPDKPFFAAATDGVGSKLELAKAHNCPEVIGRDVVAMCVNDLLCAGVRPLFFLDYIACDKLRPAFIAAIVRGIAAACEESGCALVGGETAEMPGTYASGKFDVAGFAGGVADGEELLRAENISAGDALIAIASNGAHSNGYALIHRLLREQTKLAEKEINGENVVTALLRPTRLYCRPIEHLRRAVRVRGLAHITGGGVDGNLPRIFPPGLHAEYKMPPLPPLFQLLQDAGKLDDETMHKVFNCGVGMVVVVVDEDADAAIAALQDAGETAWRFGVVLG